MIVLNIANPSSPEFLSSLFLLPDGDRLLGWVLPVVMSSTFQAYILVCLVQVVQLIFGPIALFIFTMSDIVGGQQRGKIGKVDADEEAEVRLYRELQLLTDEYNNLLAAYHMNLHGLTVALVTLCFYLSVRSEEIVAVVALYVAIWLLATYCEMMNNYAEIQSGSNKFLESLEASCYLDDSRNWVRTSATVLWETVHWRRCFGCLRRTRSGARAAVLSRQIRSLRELHIRAGSSAFYFDKQLVLTAISVILDQSVNLLLTT